MRNACGYIKIFFSFSYGSTKTTLHPPLVCATHDTFNFLKHDGKQQIQLS